MAKKKQYNKQLIPEDQNEEALYVRVEAPIEEEEKVEFDAWFVSREQKIPRAHRKEIIKADFKARGLGEKETMKDFDAALAKYGLKL